MKRTLVTELGFRAVSPPRALNKQQPRRDLLGGCRGTVVGAVVERETTNEVDERGWNAIVLVASSKEISNAT